VGVGYSLFLMVYVGMSERFMAYFWWVVWWGFYVGICWLGVEGFGWVWVGKF